MTYNRYSLRVNSFLIVVLGSAATALVPLVSPPFLLVFVGFLWEESLHLALYSVAYRDFTPQCHVYFLGLVPLRFSIDLPDELSRGWRVAVLLVAPIGAIVIGVALASLLALSPLESFFLILVPIVSIMPINAHGVRTDMYHALSLMRNAKGKVE